MSQCVNIATHVDRRPASFRRGLPRELLRPRLGQSWIRSISGEESPACINPRRQIFWRQEKCAWPGQFLQTSQRTEQHGRPDRLTLNGRKTEALVRRGVQDGLGPPIEAGKLLFGHERQAQESVSTVDA